jgi:hypothetical protein
MANPEAKMYADSIVEKVEKIVSCLDGRSTEQINVRPPINNANSLLVLAVHTMANVREAIFEILLGQPVNRNRDSEFASSGGSAEDVRKQWEELKSRVQPAIEGLTQDQLDARYDDHRRGPNTGRGILLITATHASEHVGHAEITRDWLTSQT